MTQPTPVPRIFQINTSPGGVPKLARQRAQVTFDGLDEDRQQNLKHHGGPDRALCLYSLERILALQAEGHPIFPGAAGENLTISGLPWEEIEPGQRLRLGDEVEIEVVSYTVPCATIKGCFDGGNANRISQKHHPGWSRVYARVVRPGPIAVGMKVTRI